MLDLGYSDRVSQLPGNISLCLSASHREYAVVTANSCYRYQPPPSAVYGRHYKIMHAFTLLASATLVLASQSVDFSSPNSISSLRTKLGNLAYHVGASVAAELESARFNASSSSCSTTVRLHSYQRPLLGPLRSEAANVLEPSVLF